MHDLARSATIRRLLGITGASLFAGFASQLTGYIPDPAWASLRYAEHLAAGAGPVWNLGGERVEGFASPLLLGLQVVALNTGIDPMAATQFVGFAAALATLGVMYRLGERVVGALAAAVAVLFVGATPAFALWAVGGTDTPIVALLLTFATLDLLGGGARWAGVALALLPLLRPEGILLALPVAVAGAFAHPNWKTHLARLLFPVAGVALVAVLARLWVFGQAVPNMVHIRFGAAEPVATASEFIQMLAPALPFAVLGAVAAGGMGGRIAVGVFGVASATLLSMDGVSAFARPAIAFWPLLALLAGRGLLAMGQLRRGLLGGFALVLGLGGVVHALRGVPGLSEAAAYESARDLSQCRSAVRSSAAHWLKPRLGPTDSYMVSDTGEFSVLAGGTSFDLLGLHDPELAATGRPSFGSRARWALKVRPTWFVIRGKADEKTVQPFYGTERALVANEEFLANYTLVTSFAKDRCDVTMWMYQAR